jgi:tetratricopeptide (TPR) repeat protein
MRLRGAAIVLVLLAASVAVRADPAPTAREHFQRGSKLYNLGHYAEAAREFEAAYEIKDDPALLFNIGQANRQAGESKKALLAYRSYLRNIPEAPNRKLVETTIAELQTQIEREQKVEAPAPPPAAPEKQVVVIVQQPVPAPPPKQPLYKKWWLWTTVGVVAVGVGLGLGLGLGLHHNNEPVLPPATGAP